MLPLSHQPARFSASAKTHKFDNISDINVNNLKLLPIIGERRHVTTKQGKLYQIIWNRWQRINLLSTIHKIFHQLSNLSISEDEEDVSYDDESLFTNILIKDNIDFIREEIYVHKKLESVFSNLCSGNYSTNYQQNVHLVLQKNFGNK